jgi:hypothetical protein
MTDNGYSIDNGYNSTSEIERDVERSRARVSATLRELRERMSPGQIVDEVLDFASTSGGADFARNLRRSVVDNPLPLLLIGSGIAWLMTTGNGRPQAGRSADQFSTRDTTGRPAWMRDSAKSSSGTIGETMGDMAQQAGDMASAAADSLRGAAEGVSGTVSEYAGSASELASSATSSARNLGGQVQRTWSTLAEEQPLVLGAMGLALGVLLGSGLPSTRTEDRLMGDASDALKSEVKEEAAHQYENVKDVAGEAFKTVQDELDLAKGPAAGNGDESEIPR